MIFMGFFSFRAKFTLLKTKKSALGQRAANNKKAVQGGFAFIYIDQSKIR